MAIARAASLAARPSHTAGVLTATAGGLHVHHRHWPGALAVGAMSLVSSVFLFAVRHILCL